MTTQAILFRTISDGLSTLCEQDLKILSLCDLMSDRIIAQDAEILALREGLAALSNRIEAVVRAQAELREDTASALVEGGTLG